MRFDRNDLHRSILGASPVLDPNRRKSYVYAESFFW